MEYQKASWTAFKNFHTQAKTKIYYLEETSFYDLFTVTDGLSLKCTLQKTDPASSDQSDFEDNFKGKSNTRETTSQTLGIPIVASRKEERDFKTIVTHNFCDNTSWTSPSSSTWEVKPSSDEVIVLSRSEIQFSDDLDLTSDKVILDYYAWTAPATETIVETIEFDNFYNIYELGNSHFYSSVHGITTVQFNQEYQIVLHGDELLGSLSKIVVRTDANSEVTGTYVTASFVTETRPV